MKHLQNIPGMIMMILVVAYWGYVAYCFTHTAFEIVLE